MEAPLKLCFGMFLALIFFDSATVNHANQNFTINPMNVTTYFGAIIEFQCLHSENRQYTWYINGLPLQMWESHNHNESCSDPILFRENQGIMKVLTIVEPLRECNGLQIQCVASMIDLMTNMTTNIERSRTATLILEELHFKTFQLSGRNGSILITWELPIYVMDQDNNIITYELSVTSLNDSTGQCYTIPISGPNISMYRYNPVNASACDRVRLTLMPSINENEGRSSSKDGSLYQDLSDGINYSITIASVTFDENLMNITDSELVYDLLSSNQIHVCVLSINAINLHTKDIFQLEKRLGSQQTTQLTLRVNNTELPFDEDYNVTMEIKNSETSSHRMNGSIRLSTQAIQNTIYENHLLQLSYVHNTSARGALVIIGNTHDYDYMTLTKDIMEYNISDYNISCDNINCTLLVYPIREDGLPKLNTSLRPITSSLKHHLQNSKSSRSPASDTEPGPGSIANNHIITASAEMCTRRLMTFKCSVDDTSGNLGIEGCIAIVHSDVDSSIVIVNKVIKNMEFKLLLNETLFKGEQHQFAIFPWKKGSGLLESRVVAKGIAMLQKGSTILSPGAIAGIVLAVISIIIMIIIVIVALYMKLCHSHDPHCHSD